MKHFHRLLQFVKWNAAGWLALTLTMAASAQTVPPLINYQGKLTDQYGNPLSTGIYAIQFRIWNDSVAAGTNNLIWGQQQNVTVQTNGVFDVILGSPGGSPISGATPMVNNLAYAFAGTNCFLGVTVVSSNGVSLTASREILPRQQLLSVPFAISAGSANTVISGAIGSQQIALGAIQNSNLATGIVALTNLAPRVFLTTNSSPPIGAVSASVGVLNYTVPDASEHVVPGLNVNLNTSGRPVLILTQPSGGSSTEYVDLWNGTYNFIRLYRDSQLIASWICSSGGIRFYVQQPVFYIDNPPAGLHNYYITLQGQNANGSDDIDCIQLIGLEL